MPRDATTARAPVRGTKGTPTLVHRQEPPGLGHTRCRALLGQAKNSARARAACGTPYPTPYPRRPPLTARVNRGVVGEIVACFFNGKMRNVPHFPLKSRGSRGSFPPLLSLCLQSPETPAALRLPKGRQRAELHPSSAVSSIRSAVDLPRRPRHGPEERQGKE